SRPSVKPNPVDADPAPLSTTPSNSSPSLGQSQEQTAVKKFAGAGESGLSTRTPNTQPANKPADKPRTEQTPAKATVKPADEASSAPVVGRSDTSSPIVLSKQKSPDTSSDRKTFETRLQSHSEEKQTQPPASTPVAGGLPAGSKLVSRLNPNLA